MTSMHSLMTRKYLSILSPRLTYEESANHLKLVFPEGEIDFIVAAKITDLASEPRAISLKEIPSGVSPEVEIEHPVEIAIKKLIYRGAMLKVRDMFDIAVVGELFPELLRTNLHHVARLKPAILGRLNSVSEDFLRLEID